MSKFDAARAAGEMKPTATLGTGTTEGKKTKIPNLRLFVREFRITVQSKLLPCSLKSEKY